ncbi:MAG: cytochrome c biogenesis protein CcsA, partial [Crocinitomicaceae bacterium]|nr:cytochrome c biogenesis protein CcsA [Crocinitomicaceae bacterium]
MGLMALALFAFFVAIGYATFVENDYGTPVAQKLIYKANWFSAIILYLTFSLIFNIFRFKLLQWKKISSLTFHVSFIIIVAGAAFTRYFGWEGAMVIPEGGSSNEVISSDTYIYWNVNDEVIQYTVEEPVILEEATTNHFYYDVDFPGETEKISLEFVELIQDVKDSLIPTAPKFGDPFLEIVIPGEQGREYYYIKSGEKFDALSFKISFNDNSQTDAIRVQETDSGLYFMTPYDLTYFQMADQTEGLVMRDSLQPFIPKRLYNSGVFQFVFNVYYPSAKLETFSSNEETDLKQVTAVIKQGSLVDTISVRGGKGIPMTPTQTKLGNLNHRFGFGSTVRRLPFYIYLDDFKIDKYPGTDKASSFSSFITVVDPDKGTEEPHHIFMNNVMDHGGYRFFQSSYKEGATTSTILSVNQDGLGTMTTYIGYFLLGLGFVLNLFSRSSRFKLLLKKSKEVRIKREALALLVLFSVGYRALAQEQIIDSDHADKYGHLVIQDFNGRFKPVHTTANEVLRKVSRQTSYEGLTPMQVFLGIHTNVFYWNTKDIIYVSGKGVREKIGIDGNQKRTSIQQFFDPNDFSYKLEADVKAAQQKKPSSQSQYDKDILKTDERVSILLGVMGGTWLKIMPLPGDSTNTWYSPFEQDAPFQGMDKMLFDNIIPWYNSSVKKGFDTGDWSGADSVVYAIDTYQRNVAPEGLLPSKSTIDLEITYNNLNLFQRLMNYYILVGMVLLIIQFVKLFRPGLKDKWVSKIGFYAFLLLFVAHGVGLGLRWYLSGHAPWSNGYEAVVFIGWVTVLSGLLYSKNSKIVLGATGVLAWLMLFVAHMNQMDPEITTLVPVLKSYWLMIHVAIITGSYGFLGLGAIIGLVCLIMNLFLTESNKKRVQLTTTELTYVTEMVMTIGLFMLTIGTFLGGVWANESWGRYWGWDAKETWALASVLVYAIVLHLRFIPFLKSKFVFNAASLVAYGSIIMTFFGVNFYLTGLHSYATGDPVPIPTWVPITIGAIFVLIGISYWRKTVVFGTSLSKMGNKKKKKDEVE